MVSINIMLQGKRLIEPYYTRASNKLNLVGELRLMSAKIRKVATVAVSDQTDLGSFKMIVRNGQQLLLRANIESTYDILCIFTRNGA